MRSSRFPVTILAASLVVLVMTASLCAAALATYFTVRNGQLNGIRPDSLAGPYRPLVVALLVGLLVSAILCTLLWRTFLHQLRALDAARRKSESMFSTVLDAVPYWIWWKDTEGVFLGCNREFVAAAGRQDAGQILGKTDFDLPWPHDEAIAYRADDRAVLASNRPKRHIVEPLTCATSEIRWVDTTKVPLLDANGVPYGVLGVAEDITERKEAEDALRHEKALTEAIFDSLPGVIHIYDDQDRLVRWNTKAAELSGFSDEELKFRIFADGRTGEDRARVLDAYRRAKRDGRAIVETYLLTKGGTRDIPIFITGVRVMLEGRPHVVAIGVDIAERKRAEEALLREKAVIDALFDNVPALLSLYDDAGRLVRWNRRTNEITGFSDAESAAMVVGDRQPPEERERIITSVQQVLRDGLQYSQEATLLTKRGARLPFYFTGVRVILDGKPHLLSIGVDITERKQAEDALRREKALTDAAFDNTPGLLILFDERHIPVRWNAKFLETTGYTADDMTRKVVSAQHPEDERAALQGALDGIFREGHAELEMDLITQGGKRIPFYYTGARLILGGKPHALVLGMDVAERKRAEEQLRRAMEQAEAANRAKDHFLAAVSHELRTPLAPILFLSSTLEADPSIPTDVRNDLTDIREHAEIEKRLIGDLLDFSAIHSGKLQIRPVPTDVHDVLRAAIRTCRDGIDRKRLRLHVSLDAQHHQTHGDPDRLRQVFWNLIQNACKFTPDECDISVRTSDDDEGLTLRIEVADTGMGMTPETLQRVFRPFEQGPRDQRTQHVGGLGLGLAISRSIVDAHGGSVTASSDGPGRGSAFVVRLPVTVKAPSVTLPIAPNLAPPERQSLRLLLVEDHPLTLKLLGRLLSAEGHEVTTATTVEAALRAADERPFDLVLSDLTLPDGSGLDLMPLLRDRHHLPGIALSGHGSPEDLEVSRRAGFLAHLTKPVTPEALRTALARFATSQLTPSSSGT